MTEAFKIRKISKPLPA